MTTKPRSHERGSTNVAMATEDRTGVQDALEQLRSSLVGQRAWLFVGEGASSLPNHVTTWWNLFEGHEDQTEVCVDLVRSCEQNALEDPARVYLFNTLRMVCPWPGAISLNLDHLVEKLLWKGESNVEKLRLDQLSAFSEEFLPPADCKCLIKVFGDIGLVTRFSPSLRSILTNPSKSVEKTLRSILDSKSFVFLGVDRTVYAEFFTRFVVNSKQPHYMLSRDEITHLERIGQLSIVYANLDLWEFVMYLSPGHMDSDLIPGHVYERCYLATQRAEYLEQQLNLEKLATEISYHTLQITNALATDEILIASSKPKLRDIYRQDPIGTFVESDVECAFQMMLARRNFLWQIINRGEIPVKSIFFYEEFSREVEQTNNLKQRQMAVRKYADAIQRARSVLRPNSTLELFVVDGLDEEEMKSLRKETFAHLKIRGGRDEAICYAEMAKPGEKLLQTHLVVVNGAEVANKRRIVDRSLARAWSHRDSILRMAAKLVEVDRIVRALEPKDRKFLESLHGVVSMLDKSIDAKSLDFLGGGSFGDVYRAQWNGIPVALKFLKDAARPEDIAGFESEFRQLKQAEHMNIVKVYKLTVENNRLGLIMEFVDGGNLRQLLLDHGAQSADVAYRCASHVAAAINHLHSLMIVHRDVKTDNILLKKDLSVFKLADFGLASMIEQTEQYKTVAGTYRYMAPEVLGAKDKNSAKYSLRVDVYSYGLVILELVTGTQVFSGLNKDELEQGKRDGRLKVELPSSCEEVYGVVLSEVIRLATRPASTRPPMSTIYQILQTNSLPKQMASPEDENCSILCLGTGKGATALMQGEPSSSFAILNKGKLLLLVDLGLGVTSSVRQNLTQDLEIGKIYITHNHADHAAELPVVLAVLQHRRKEYESTVLPTVFAAPQVMDRIRKHRMTEICDEISHNELANWKTCPAYPKMTAVDSSETFFISPVQSQHTEVCYGFLLYKDGEPLLGFTGDSGFNKELYDRIFEAPNVVIDARAKSSSEHAGFAEVQNYINVHGDRKTIFITGYGIDSEFPDDEMSNVIKFIPGQKYSLNEKINDVVLTSEYMSTSQAIKIRSLGESSLSPSN